jgi:exopolyphosphatase/guanosine-5'-triphosphate,3'-diphosphate pyrophosphatase
MRIAAIDIGTNSIHMIVVQIRPDLSFEVIDREKEMVRLGAGGLDGRALTPEAMHAALQVLAKFRRLAESHRVDDIVAVATSATREAENGGDFLRTVTNQIGIRPQVISGTEEARLIHSAAVYGIGIPRDVAVVVDIGGGSVEVTRGDSAGVELGRSFKLGVIRLTERFVKTDPLEPRAERKLVRYIDEQIGRYLDQIARSGFARVIGTSGTILSLGAVALAEDGQLGIPLRNRRISTKQLRRLRKDLVSMSIDKRLRVPGLEPRRADLVVAGAILIDFILQRLGADEITLCDLSLREGLVLDYVSRHRQQIVHADRYPDVRRRSVVELAERCNYFPAHSHQVARLATSLFDQTRVIHGLTDRERDWLEYASILHDVGVHISYERHHRHSYYLIKNGDLRGFDPEEIEVMALVARYHRQATPKRSHDEFGDLKRKKRRIVRTLAAILRLAESLDRSHAQSVGAIELHDRGDDDLLQVRTVGDAELELWAAQRHAAPFERMTGKPLRIEAGRLSKTEEAHAQYADATPRVPGQIARRRGDRRVRQDDAARPAREMADRRRPPRLHHRMELVRPGQGGDQDGQEEKRADAHDVQPAARDGLR